MAAPETHYLLSRAEKNLQRKGEGGDFFAPSDISHTGRPPFLYYELRAPKEEEEEGGEGGSNLGTKSLLERQIYRNSSDTNNAAEQSLWSGGAVDTFAVAFPAKNVSTAAVL